MAGCGVGRQVEVLHRLSALLSGRGGVATRHALLPSTAAFWHADYLAICVAGGPYLCGVARFLRPL